MIKITKEHEYVVLTPNSPVFDDAVSAAMEKAVVGLYSSEGMINFIVDLDLTSDLAVSAVTLFDKIIKIAKREGGLFLTVVNNDDVMDVMADNSQFEIVMLSSVEEAIEVVYMNDSGSEFDDEEDNEYGEENDY